MTLADPSSFPNNVISWVSLRQKGEISHTKQQETPQQSGFVNHHMEETRDLIPVAFKGALQSLAKSLRHGGVLFNSRNGVHSGGPTCVMTELSGQTSAHLHSTHQEVCAPFPTPPKPSLTRLPGSRIVGQKCIRLPPIQPHVTQEPDPPHPVSNPYFKKRDRRVNFVEEVSQGAANARARFLSTSPRRSQPYGVPQVYVCLQQEKRAGTQGRLWIGQRKGTVQVLSPTIGRGPRASFEAGKRALQRGKSSTVRESCGRLSRSNVTESGALRLRRFESNAYLIVWETKPSSPTLYTEIFLVILLPRVQ